MTARTWLIVVVGGAILLLTARSVAAQEKGRLIGVVVSEARGIPIPRALVALEGGGETVANADGTFVLDGVRAGLYRIAAVAPGCHVGLGDVQVQADRDLRLQVTVALTEDAEDRLEAWDLGRRSLGESVKALTADEIQKRHVRTVWDALRIMAPSMVGWETSQVGGRRVLRNRGAPTVLLQAEPLVIVDGIRIPQSSIDALADLDAADIELIEVMRGGAGGWRYGMQGVNGVVRITTRSAAPAYEKETPPSACAFRFTR